MAAEWHKGLVLCSPELTDEEASHLLAEGEHIACPASQSTGP